MARRLELLGQLVRAPASSDQLHHLATVHRQGVLSASWTPSSEAFGCPRNRVNSTTTGKETTMTSDEIALQELLEKGSDADLLRQMIGSLPSGGLRPTRGSPSG